MSQTMQGFWLFYRIQLHRPLTWLMFAVVALAFTYFYWRVAQDAKKK